MYIGHWADGVKRKLQGQAKEEDQKRSRFLMIITLDAEDLLQYHACCFIIPDFFGIQYPYDIQCYILFKLIERVYKKMNVKI